jgi:hypothetical protein
LLLAGGFSLGLRCPHRQPSHESTDCTNHGKRKSHAIESIAMRLLRGHHESLRATLELAPQATVRWPSTLCSAAKQVTRNAKYGVRPSLLRIVTETAVLFPCQHGILMELGHHPATGIPVSASLAARLSPVLCSHRPCGTTSAGEMTLNDRHGQQPFRYASSDKSDCQSRIISSK